MRRAFAFAALAAIACAPGPAVRRPAGSLYDLSQRDEVFRRAERALAREGYAVALRDPDAGHLMARPTDRLAPCAAGLCASRDFLQVWVQTNGIAVVSLVRLAWDDAARGWRPLRDRAAVAAVQAQEEALLRAIVGPELKAKQAGEGETCRTDDQCAIDLACSRGVCIPTCDAFRECPHGQVCGAAPGSSRYVCIDSLFPMEPQLTPGVGP